MTKYGPIYAYIDQQVRIKSKLDLSLSGFGEIGMELSIVNWIMGCIQSISFTILINDAPSRFFRDMRGLRQGFPLSPFLFLIVVEKLIQLLNDGSLKGNFKVIKVASQESMSHILFVDVVLCFFTCIKKGPFLFKINLGPLLLSHWNEDKCRQIMYAHS
jgi:hypothetical protein